MKKDVIVRNLEKIKDNIKEFKLNIIKEFRLYRKSIFISENNNHLYSILVIFMLAMVLFYKNFFENGQLLYVDMLFPYGLERTFEFFSNTWYPYGSFSLVPITLLRMPWILLSLIPARIIGMNYDNYLLSLFIFTFFIAGLSSYILTYYTIKTFINGDKKDKNKNIISIASCFASLVYMYNPLSLGFFWAYGFYPTYAFLPLILLLVLISLNTNGNTNRIPYRNRILYVFITAFFMTLASTSPHGIIWIISILIYSVIVFIYGNIENFELKKILNILKISTTIFILYLLMMSFWIFPSIFIFISGGNIQPPYNFKEPMLNSFSKTSDLDKSLRLISGTRFLIDPEFIGSDITEEKIPKFVSDMRNALKESSFTNPMSVDNQFWIFCSYLIPILAFGSLYLYRKSQNKKIIYFFVILSSIAIFLSLGTNSSFPFIYKWLALYAPWSSSFGWIFRLPYRFLIFATLGFSTLCGYSIFKILDSGYNYDNKNKIKKSLMVISCVILAIFFLIGIIYFFIPIARAHADYIFSPTKIPDEYNNINEWLANQDGDFKVLWLPRYPGSGYFHSWAPYKRAGPINVVSSYKETYSNYFNKPISDYFYWFNRYVRDNKNKNNISEILTLLDIRYIILDNSIKNVDIDMKDILNNSDLKLVFNDNFIYVYENTGYISQHIYITKKNLGIDNLVQFQIDDIYSKRSKNIHYEKIGNSEYKVKFNTNGSFILAFAETYDPLWEATVYDNGIKEETVKSMPLYSTINSFPINTYGNLEIFIRYKPQQWFELGLLISIITVIACIGYNIYLRKNNK